MFSTADAAPATHDIGGLPDVQTGADMGDEYEDEIAAGNVFIDDKGVRVMPQPEPDVEEEEEADSDEEGAGGAGGAGGAAAGMFTGLDDDEYEDF